MCKLSIKLYKNFEMFSVPCLNIYRDEGGPNQTKGAQGQKKKMLNGAATKNTSNHTKTKFAARVKPNSKSLINWT